MSPSTSTSKPIPTGRPSTRSPDLESLSAAPKDLMDTKLSSSYQDVTLVAPKAAADSSVQLATRTKLQRASATELLDGQGARSRACQEHENELAEIVIVCEPEGTSLMMGGLHPRASLYERPVNLDAAKAAHAEFRRVMREAGLKVDLLPALTFVSD